MTNVEIVHFFKDGVYEGLMEEDFVIERVIYKEGNVYYGPFSYKLGQIME